MLGHQPSGDGVVEHLIRALLAFAAGAILLSGCDSGGSSTTVAEPAAPADPVAPADPAPADPAPTSTVSVSGTLLSDPILELDSDINDPEATPSSNDLLILAQSIQENAEVRGFVTAQGTDDDNSGDNFALASDVSDFYTATISAGQDLVMTFSDYLESNPSAVDVDLYLYTSLGILINGSILVTSPTEQITVSQSGTYIIEVRAFRGTSNYSLTLGQAEQVGPETNAQIELASMAPRRATIMRGEVEEISKAFTTLGKPSTTFSALERESARPRSLWLTDTDLPLDKEGPFSGRFPLAAVMGLDTDALDTDPSHEQKLALLRHIKQTNSLAAEDILHPYHYPRYAAAAPQDADLQWNLPAIEWQEALTEVENAAPTVGRPLIAVIDSGIFSSHPKFATALTDARDFVPEFIDGDEIDDADAAAGGGNAAEADEDVVLGDANPDACYSFHGSHVASIAVAPSAGGTIDGINMDGVVPFADLMMLKVGNSTSPNCEFIVGDIAGAIRYAAGLPNSSGVLPPRAADVINMSFGGPQPDPATQAAIEDAVAAGVILVAASGNDGQGSSLPEYPAAFNEVFAVAATNLNNNRAFYSSAYAQVEIAAPGGDGRADLNSDGQVDAILGAIAEPNVTETAFEADYALYQGTSMAAPHVAAGFALMKAIYPDLNTNEARQFLEEGLLTADIDAEGRDDNTGYGLMSLKKMVDTAIQVRDGTLVIPPDFRITPSTLDFGGATTTATLTITRSGNPTFTISDITTTNGSLAASVTPDPTPINVDADGFGTYSVVINRTDAAPGSYAVEVQISSSEGVTKTVPLSFEVPDQSALANTAPTRVFLQNEVSPGVFTTVATVIAEGGAGSTVTFSNVETGSYRIVYTTDMDNDGNTCDNGELGGAFPGGDCEALDTFSVTADTTNLEFVLARITD